jgi:hypothetical protein
MDERNSQYELQPSKNGHTVPVINGVYLHSIYNPLKEAEAFVNSKKKNLQYKNKVLVLGLGFGYHVEEISKLLECSNKDFEIIVLEPNERLVKDFINTRNFENPNIKIVCKQKIKELFGDWTFIKFLMEKPCIIKHDASFILEKEFYTNFLAYQAPKDIINYKSLLSESSKTLFDSREARDFSSFITHIEKSNHIASKNEFLLLALNQINKMNYQGN